MAEARDNSNVTIPPCPKCKKTLEHPVRMKCLHSYCRKCLNDIPKREYRPERGTTAGIDDENQTGWNCLLCDTFTNENEVRPDTLLETLLAKESSEDVNKAHVCPDRRMEICSICNQRDEKPQDGNQTLEETCVKKDMIDEVSYCNIHQMQEVIYCSTHDQFICLVCQVDHKNCQTQTTNAVLKNVIVEIDKYAKNISSKLKIADMQVKDLEKEKQNIMKAFNNWEEHSDIQLEWFINKLKETKSALNKQVKLEASKTIQELNEPQSKIQKQAERFRIFEDTYEVIKMKTKNQSQLLELQSGVLERGKELHRETIDMKTFIISTPDIDLNLYEYNEYQLKRLISHPQYMKTSLYIDHLEHILTTEISDSSCNRLNIVNKSLYIGVPDDNIVKMYNTDGQCLKTYNNVNDTIVVKQANNGDIITGGKHGLFTTNNEFTKPSQILPGQYSDIAIHGDTFYALDYKQYKVVTFRSCNDRYARKWELLSSFDIAKKQRTDWRGDETLIVDRDNTVIICSNNKLLVYSSNGKYLKTITLFGTQYRFSGIDRNNNVILCEFHRGEVYSINNIHELDPYDMQEYLMFKKKEKTLDMTIDCDGNFWLLHFSKGAYYLSKYVSRK